MAKKSKKSDTAVGVALVALAAGAAYWLFGRDDGKPSTPKDSPDEPDPDVDPEGPIPPAPPPQKIDAPEYSYDAVTKYQEEQALANAQHGYWVAALGEAADDVGSNSISDPEVLALAPSLYGVPPGRSPASWMTDIVFYQAHPELSTQIPKASLRGEGWQPYVAAWMRTWDYVKTLSPKVPTNWK